MVQQVVFVIGGGEQSNVALLARPSRKFITQNPEVLPCHLEQRITYLQGEKNLLVCNCALTEIEHLIVGHQGTMQPKPPRSRWVLSNSPAHKVG